MKGENIMQDNYNFENATMKDYSNEISDIDKLRIMLNAYKAAKNITKEELKKEVDLVLS